MLAQRFFDVLMYTILAALVVLVVMNAGGVANLINAFSGFWVTETGLLTGSGYVAPK